MHFPATTVQTVTHCNIILLHLIIIRPADMSSFSVTFRRIPKFTPHLKITSSPTSQHFLQTVLYTQARRPAAERLHSGGNSPRMPAMCVDISLNHVFRYSIRLYSCSNTAVSRRGLFTLYTQSIRMLMSESL